MIFNLFALETLLKLFIIIHIMDIKSFIKQFTDKDLKCVRKIGRDYYLIEDDVYDLKFKLSLEFFSAGIFLGEQKGDYFRSSPALLTELSKISDRKIFINEKAEWLFLCGKNIFAESILKANVDSGIVLVQNEKDECLGYGEIHGDLKNNQKIAVENLLNLGKYLGDKD
jgi:ribosome biogenesis protein Nip4